MEADAPSLVVREDTKESALCTNQASSRWIKRTLTRQALNQTDAITYRQIRQVLHRIYVAI